MQEVRKEFLQSEYDDMLKLVEDLKAQLNDSKKELRELKEAEASAKEKGDLSENSELDEARRGINSVHERMNTLSVQIENIQLQINNAIIVKEKQLSEDDNIIKIGDTITLKIEGIDNLPELAKGQKWKITEDNLLSKNLVPQSPEDVGTLVYNKPVAKALLGRQWNDRPIEVQYTDNSNKIRTIVVLDVNGRLAKKNAENNL